MRMTICAVDASGTHVLETERAPVRLGHHAFTRGELDPETIDDAVTTFARFRQRFDHHGVQHYRAVATSALRSARNRELLQDRIWLENAIRLDVIDGDEEARLTGKAVAHAFRDRPAPAVVLDLGGGSLEISFRSDEEEAWEIVSLRVGTVRLLESFGLLGPVDDGEARMIRRYAKTALRSARPSHLPDRLEPAAACGGNAEALAKLFGAFDEGMPCLDLKALRQELPTLLAADVPTRMREYRVTRDRAEVMAVAGLVLVTVCRDLKIKRLLMPGVGIKEGVLLDLAGDVMKARRPGVGARRKALLASARSFAERLGHDISHGETVRRLASSLFDQLSEAHGLGMEERTVLELACLLHDVGEVVHRRGHHKHSEYLILSGRIPGLKGTQRDMVAALARTHRKSPPDLLRHETFARLPEDKRAIVLKLCALLRVADSLDTDHRQRVISVRCAPDGEGELDLALAVRAGEPATPPPMRKIVLFQQQYGLQVVFSTRAGRKTR